MFDSERFKARLADGRYEPHWLYRIYDGDGRLLYIGQTRRPTGRFAIWKSEAKHYGPSQQMMSAARKVVWQLYADWWKVIDAEREAIKEEGPIFNRQHNRPRQVAV